MKNIKLLVIVFALFCSAFQLKAQNAQWDDNCRSVGCEQE